MHTIDKARIIWLVSLDSDILLLELEPTHFSFPLFLFVLVYISIYWYFGSLALTCWFSNLIWLSTQESGNQTSLEGCSISRKALTFWKLFWLFHWKWVWNSFAPWWCPRCNQKSNGPFFLSCFSFSFFFAFDQLTVLLKLAFPVTFPWPTYYSDLHSAWPWPSFSDLFCNTL